MVKHLSSQSNLPKVIFIVLLLVPAVVIFGFVALANQNKAQAAQTTKTR